METVAAEMARASDTLGEPDDDRVSMREASPRSRSAGRGGGATIVPLRTGEP